MGISHQRLHHYPAPKSLDFCTVFIASINMIVWHKRAYYSNQFTNWRFDFALSLSFQMIYIYLWLESLTVSKLHMWFHLLCFILDLVISFISTTWCMSCDLLSIQVVKCGQRYLTGELILRNESFSVFQLFQFFLYNYYLTPTVTYTTVCTAWSVPIANCDIRAH